MSENAVIDAVMLADELGEGCMMTSGGPDPARR